MVSKYTHWSNINLVILFRQFFEFQTTLYFRPNILYISDLFLFLSVLNRNNFILEKYDSSNLDRNSSQELFEKVRKLFIEEHIFMESDISLNNIAEKLSASSREISQVINENEEQNFKEFVNQYRVEYAKVLLNNSMYRNEKIATIAYDSGFGTVTAFNVAFKKKTGITPSAYRKQHLFN